MNQEEKPQTKSSQSKRNREAWKFSYIYGTIFDDLKPPYDNNKTTVSQLTIENNDQVKSHFAQLHVTKIFWSFCKGLLPKLFFIGMPRCAKVRQGAPRCAKVRFWRFLEFNTMKINFWGKFDNFVSL